MEWAWGKEIAPTRQQMRIVLNYETIFIFISSFQDSALYFHVFTPSLTLYESTLYLQIFILRFCSLFSCLHTKTYTFFFFFFFFFSCLHFEILLFIFVSSYQDLHFLHFPFFSFFVSSFWDSALYFRVLIPRLTLLMDIQFCHNNFFRVFFPHY